MDWKGLLQDLLYVVIIGTVPIITKYLVDFLRKLFNKVETTTNDSVVSSTLEKVEELILSTVSSTSQTYVDQLKTTGKFTEEAQKEAFNRTKETIISLLNTESIEILKSLYDDIDRWLDIQIESSVRLLKENEKVGE